MKYKAVTFRDAKTGSQILTGFAEAKELPETILIGMQTAKKEYPTHRSGMACRAVTGRPNTLAVLVANTWCLGWLELQPE